MDRRAFIVGTAAVLATPLDAEAQAPAKVPRIGFLSARPPTDNPYFIESFRQGLRELGYVEGQNIAIEYRFAEGKPELLPALAAELVRMKVDVIVAWATEATLAAKQATTTIPIVMTGVADPVKSGLVASLARPGGNVTGTTTLAADLSGKLLEMLKETVPDLSRVAVLWNGRSSAMELRVKEAEAAARALGVTLQSVGVQGPD